MSNWKNRETAAQRAIEDHGFVVFDANVLFRANCPNIDLVVCGKTGAIYVQVKSSETPASKDGVVVDGSPWTVDQLEKDAPIFNKHREPGNCEATFVVIVDRHKNGDVSFYIAPPDVLEKTLRKVGRAFAKKPKKDGTQRSLGFRKELSREQLAPWLEAWGLLESAVSAL
jgi:Holliday junction resolvase-like predicted endonuclease